MRIDTDKLRREADAKLAAARAEHARMITKIQEIEQLARNGDGQADTVPQRLASKPVARKAGAKAVRAAPSASRSLLGVLRPMILESLAHKPDGATLAEVVSYVGPQASKKQIARALYRMHKDEEIRMTRPQSGMVPGLYALLKREKVDGAK